MANRPLTNGNYAQEVVIVDQNGNITSPTINLTTTFSNQTGSGTIASGCVCIQYANIGTANATIGGATIPPGTSSSLPVISGATYSSVAYNATGTNLLLVEIR